MIDLHTHTWFSDGNLSPTQLVRMAKEKGIETLSISDHDGTFGLAEGAAEAARLGIRFINGIEFSACLSGLDGVGDVYMHILGYQFDPENQRLLSRVRDIREQRRVRNERMLALFNDMGFELTRKEVELYPNQDYIGKPNFARALVNRGYAKDVGEVFASERLLASPKIKAIRREKIEAEEAVQLIKGAGGFASLAHPYQISYPGKWEDSQPQFLEKLEAVLSPLKGRGLSAVECYYSRHSESQTRELLALAAKLGLTATAGSDYHGPGMKRDVELGKIPEAEKFVY